MLSSVIGEDTSAQPALLGMSSIRATKALSSDCQRTFVDTPLGMVPVITAEVVEVKTITVTIPMGLPEDPRWSDAAFDKVSDRLDILRHIGDSDLRQAYGRDDYLLDLSTPVPHEVDNGMFNRLLRLAPFYAGPLAEISDHQEDEMVSFPRKVTPLYGDRPDIEATMEAIRQAAEDDNYLEDPFSGIRTPKREHSDNVCVFPNLGASSVGERNRPSLLRRISDKVGQRFGFHPDIEAMMASDHPRDREVLAGCP